MDGTAPARNIAADPDRLWDSLMEMAKVGPGVAGGNDRQTLTDADAEGRALFQRWCEAAGCTMGLDAMGTMFATARRARTRTRCRSTWAATSTRSRRGASTTACWACSAGWRCVRTLDDLGIRTPPPHRRHQLDQRGGHALRPGHAGLRRLRGDARPGLGRRPDGRRGPALRRRAGPHRLARGRAPWARARTTSAPSSSCISSRGRSWRRRAWISASSPTARGCGGSR